MQHLINDLGWRVLMAERLSFSEREDIALDLAAGRSMRSIARRLGRAPSTVSREVANHSFHRHAVEYGRPEMRYKASSAERSAAVKRARRKPAKLLVDLRLRKTVLRVAEETVFAGADRWPAAHGSP